MGGNFLKETDRTYDEDCIIMSLILSHAVNYNKFLHTLLIMPPLCLISYYFQLEY